MAAAAGDVVVDQRIARPTAGEEEVNAGPEGEGILFDPRDHLVYAWVDFYAPGATEGVVVRALVDSGSHDCELRASLIESAGLPAFGAGRLYETSAGRVIQSTFTAEVCVLGRWCEVTVAAIPEARFLPGDRAPCTDEAVIGHRVLADLDLQIDCHARTLVKPPQLEAAAELEVEDRGLAGLHKRSAEHVRLLLDELKAGHVDVASEPKAAESLLRHWCRLYGAGSEGSEPRQASSLGQSSSERVCATA
eukprot:gnl/TRDRNA2_/TRDRNA2_36484_c0_seq2.p1 gnl/TRDRNA2_/TRDRNA2_36484_c0~~gnl/TRDRNA2_/TRDRNA2_36484_c0_seq2.p1  ORF type:complete len:249 (+),score=48.01 gnl/TRDRNA2_/TRDRNA2_36484_c0_seq2:84-830(+)